VRVCMYVVVGKCVPVDMCGWYGYVSCGEDEVKMEWKAEL
jgi:hypothetical protein